VDFKLHHYRQPFLDCPRRCTPFMVKDLLTSPGVLCPSEDPQAHSGVIMIKRFVLMLCVLALCLTGLAFADEGMWLFNAFPRVNKQQ
jgi:hypothetical protein